MSDETYHRNVEVDDLLQLWEWCSRRLHIKWQRKRKLRNGCFYGLASALFDDEDDKGSPMRLLKCYKSLPTPLLNRQRVITFWKMQPLSLLELCLGAYTKASPLSKQLNRLRLDYADNSTLDDLAKKMRCRAKLFGDDWSTEGHHPDHEYRLLKKEMKPLCMRLQKDIAAESAAVSKLGLDVLAKGWQFGEVPVAYRVRKPSQPSEPPKTLAGGA